MMINYLTIVFRSSSSRGGTTLSMHEDYTVDAGTFFNQTPQLLFFSLHVLVRLPFEGGVYFFGKPTDINDGWMNNTVTTVRRCQ